VEVGAGLEAETIDLAPGCLDPHVFPAGDVVDAPCASCPTSPASPSERSLTVHDYATSSTSSAAAAGRLNDEERNLGARAIAVPVLDRDSIVAAAIAVRGPTIHLDDARLEPIANELIATAHRIPALTIARQ
jgi:Bacterial transcriptional regulator